MMTTLETPKTVEMMKLALEDCLLRHGITGMTPENAFAHSIMPAAEDFTDLLETPIPELDRLELYAAEDLNGIRQFFLNPEWRDEAIDGFNHQASYSSYDDRNRDPEGGAA